MGMGTVRRLRIIQGGLALGALTLSAAWAPSVPRGSAQTTGAGVTMIDWVNFVRYKGTLYLTPVRKMGRSITARDLGPQVARVHSKLEGNVQDPAYKPKDGDAAFLAPGTPIYSVKGYRPGFRLAARWNGQVTLYEADTSTTARTGNDLLDISGKVRVISVHGVQDTTKELGRITSPQRVAGLVALVLKAPVDQTRLNLGGGSYLLAFHLTDGTIVIRGYYPGSGELSRGIWLPTLFRTAVQQAVHR